VVGAHLGDVETGLQVEDRLAVLDGHHASGGEALAVADAVDLVQDGRGRVAGPQEVGVQRMHQPVALDGAGGGHQRLARYLATEHPLAVLVGRAPAEQVHLDHLEVEQGHQVVERALHGCSLASGEHHAHGRLRQQ
jgi:hypothetical protein